MNAYIRMPGMSLHADALEHGPAVWAAIQEIEAYLPADVKRRTHLVFRRAGLAIAGHVGLTLGGLTNDPTVDSGGTGEGKEDDTLP